MPFLPLILLSLLQLIKSDVHDACSDQWSLCSSNQYGCGCSIFRDTSLNCICQSPGFFACGCRWECSSNCATKSIGIVTTHDCVDGAFGNGFCKNCADNANSYGPNCDACYRLYVSPYCCLPMTNQKTITYPDVTGGGIKITFAQVSGANNHVWHINAVKDLAGNTVPSMYRSFCEIQYPGTTCGGLGINQALPCRCLDSSYVFRLPHPLVLDTGNADNSLRALPWWQQFDSAGNPLNAGPILSEYCCLPSCPVGKAGCRCDISCGTGCMGCSVQQSGILQGSVQCDQCQPNYYKLATPEDVGSLDLLYCKTCPSSCSICVHDTSDPNCKAYACTQPTLCANECLPGYWGPICDQLCPSICPPRSKCSQGRTGTGLCVCDDPTQIFSDVLFACINPVCGNDRVNLCNNHGICVQSIQSLTTTGEFTEYCACDEGFTGSTCNTVITKFDECDCGASWNSPYQSSLGLLTGIRLTIDLDGVTLFGSSQSSNHAGIPIGTIEQGKQMAYQDFQCDGMIVWPSPLYGLQTQQADLFPQAITIAAFFTKDTSVVTPPSNLPIGITFSVYTIDRISQNNCSNAGLDLNYYYVKTNKAVVDNYCVTTQNNIPLIDSYPNLGTATVKPCFTDYWATRHFRYYGHKFRSFKPNALCDLLPYVYSPNSYCHTSRCLSISGVGPPCMMDGQRTGYCLAEPSNPSGYQCKCLPFFQANAVGSGSLNYQPFFMGLACQFPVVAFCVNGNDKVLCNGVVGACQPIKQWNGEFFLQNFEGFRTLLNQDFLPRCNCNGSAFGGQYCETSRCPNDCKSLSLSAGNCVSTNFPINTQFACKCAPFAIGQYCEIDASICLNSNGVQCSGRGTCVVGDGVNFTTPHCICDEGFFGYICQNFYCAPDQMIPGHGTCSNGIATGCYPPYSGPACSVDNCAIYGNGKVIGNPPSGCACQYPYTNQLNGNTVASCWPQCPVGGNITCGASDTTAHVCVQFTDPMTDTRIAICNCANGYIRNATTGLCDKFCSNGNVPVGWSSTNQLPCVCDVNTGYDTNSGFNPRCDHPICGSNGVFNLTSLKCDCIPPFNSFTRCVTSLCTINNNPLATVIPDNGGYRCACPIPTKPSNDLLPYDCNGNVCTINGLVNTAFIPNVTLARNACFCKGKFRTICADNATTCTYCTNSFCLNGGAPDILDISKCRCVFPFTGENCETSLCIGAQTLISDPITKACLCKPGFTGSICNELTCLNGGLFVNNTCICDPTTSYIGTRCESLLGIPIIPTVISSSSSSSTGGSESSSSTGEETAVTTKPSVLAANLPIIIPSVAVGTIAMFGGLAVGVYFIMMNNVGAITATITEVAPLIAGRLKRK